MKKKQRILVIVVSIITLFVILFSVYLYYENNTLQVSQYEVISDHLPKEFNDFKILQITDFHNTKSHKLTNDLVTEVNKQKPNIVVLTGDLIDANRTDINVALDFVKAIKDFAPIYYVSGNHEASIKNYTDLKTGLVQAGVVILDNQTKIIEFSGAKINLLGIDDPKMMPNTVVSNNEIIRNEINNLEYEKSNFSLLLSHRPEVFDIYVENKIDLVLTGHAHGGQIRLPWIGGLYAPDQGLFPKYTSGTFYKDSTTMVVSRGIGNSSFPFRVQNRPELVVVILKSN